MQDQRLKGTRTEAEGRIAHKLVTVTAARAKGDITTTRALRLTVPGRQEQGSQWFLVLTA